MPFKQGRNKTGGRQKGTPNKIPTSVQQSVLSVYEELGGDDAFLEWASKQSDDFYLRIYSKLIPTSQRAEITQPKRALVDLTDEELEESIRNIQKEIEMHEEIKD